MTVAETGDDLLTAVSVIAPENRYRALQMRSVRILREAADLCGVDSTDMRKTDAIMAIIENF